MYFDTVQLTTTEDRFMEAGHGGSVCGKSNENTQKHLIHHGFTVTSVRSSYALHSTSSFMVNFEINGRYNSPVLDDTIYSSLLHVIRKCVEKLSVSNIIQVVNPAEPAPTITAT